MKRNRDYSDISGEKCNLYKHGLSKNPLFYTWYRMVQRCHNPNHPAYPKYGAIGRTVCDEWRNDPQAFINWSESHGYKEGLSIDRIDNEKGYSPDNCRWADRIIQQNNTCRNHWITVNGETHTVSQWARMKGVRRYVILKRLKMGWSESEAVNTPLSKRHQHFK